MDISDMKRDDMIYELNAYCDKRKSCTSFKGGDDTNCPFTDATGDDFEHMNDDQLIECLAKIGIHVNAADDIVTEEKIERVIDEIKSEMVNHPSHYCQGKVECIDAMAAATVNKRGIEAICVSNVIKYLFRYETKNGLEDVKKAAWYIDRLIKELEGK